MTTDHNTHDLGESDGWAPCEPGTFDTFKAAAHPARPFHDWKPYVAGVCLGMVLAIAGVTVKWALPESQQAPALVCHEVQPLLVAYVAGDLDTRTAAQVRNHLEICHNCRSDLNRLARNSDRALLSDPPIRPLLAVR